MLTVSKHDEARRKPLSRSELEAFAAELDAIRKRVYADLGERDARHIHRMFAWQRSAEVGGRTLLFAGALSPAWAAGVGLLALSKILENMEIGHNVMHGQYDWMNEPRLFGDEYEWDWACPGAHWRHSHNYVHHTFTNIVGKDRDIGYGLLRMADEQPWHAGFLLQPVYAVGLMLGFELGVAVHDLELNRVLRGEKSWRALLPDARPMLRKAAPQLFKDYVAFPLLAGPAAPFVFAGNLTANLLRNSWAFLVIFCGHFPDGVQMYRLQDTEGETRGEWYARQIGGSVNIEGPRWFHVLSGHLSHQIEHHLFPDLPAPRYVEIAGEVRALCRRYGIRYNSGPFLPKLATVLRRIARGTLPARRAPRSSVSADRADPAHPDHAAERSASPNDGISLASCSLSRDCDARAWWRRPSNGGQHGRQVPEVEAARSEAKRSPQAAEPGQGESEAGPASFAQRQEVGSTYRRSAPL